MNEERMMEILEQAAAPLRLQGEVPVPELPPRHVARTRTWGWRAWSGVASAAVVLVLGMLWVIEWSIPESTPYTWRSVEGLVGITKEHREGQAVPIGERIEVRDQGEVSLDLQGVGQVTLSPGSVLTILPPLDPSGDGRYRLAFERGSLHVFVNAPARAFLVETPWFDVWDLGCEYTITLDGDGNGSLVVELGKVRCEGAGFAMEVPAGRRLDFLAGQPSSSAPR